MTRRVSSSVPSISWLAMLYFIVDSVSFPLNCKMFADVQIIIVNVSYGQLWLVCLAVSDSDLVQ